MFSRAFQQYSTLRSVHPMRCSAPQRVTGPDHEPEKGVRWACAGGWAHLQMSAPGELQRLQVGAGHRHAAGGQPQGQLPQQRGPNLHHFHRRLLPQSGPPPGLQPPCRGCTLNSRTMDGCHERHRCRSTAAWVLHSTALKLAALQRQCLV